MQRTQRFFIGLSGVVLLVCVLQPVPAIAQDEAYEFVVTRNANLRPQPSKDNTPIRLLKAPEQIVSLPDADVQGYKHVRTGDAEEGWVWAKFVKPIEPQPQPFAAASIATAIDPNWGKPPPVSKSFTINSETCGATGDGGDVGTNKLKNRIDIPATYHQVTFDAVAELPYPTGPKHRRDWPPDLIDDIERYEGVALTVAGYLVANKVQSGGSGESTNCHMNRSAEVDWHLALVEEPGDGEELAVVVETTPRIRVNHPKWTAGRIKPWVDSDNPIRVSGWLMFDPEHRNHLKKYRQTLWEIHPVTKLEVWSEGKWLELDQIP